MLPNSSVANASITISQLEQDDSRSQAWDDYVDNAEQGTFFHRSAWRLVLKNPLGHKTFYLYAESDGEIKGVLPLAQVKSFLFGNALISTPFCVYGGAIAESLEVKKALEDAACDLAENLGVDYLELRNQVAERSDLLTKELYVTFRKTISSDHDENLKAIPKKQRAMVRKAIKTDLNTRFDKDINTLYDVYAESVRNLGTPVFPKDYFQALSRQFSDYCQVTTICSGDRPVSSVLSFVYKGEILPYYGGGTHEARGLKANDFMYWQVMSWAADHEISVFDYGRSKTGTGSYRFKKHWGFEPEPLAYQYHLVKAKELPNISPTNKKYSLFINAWKRLPLPVTKIVGPWLARSLG